MPSTLHTRAAVQPCILISVGDRAWGWVCFDDLLCNWGKKAGRPRRCLVMAGPGAAARRCGGSKPFRLIVFYSSALTLLLLLGTWWRRADATVRQQEWKAAHAQAQLDVGAAQALPDVLPLGAAAVLARLKQHSSPRVLIVDVKNGLGNRLRALCSAMSVAAALRRPLILVWVPDLHCNCSFSRLFEAPLPFALLEESLPAANLTSSDFQSFNYMRPEPGAVKDEEARRRIALPLPSHRIELIVLPCPHPML